MQQIADWLEELGMSEHVQRFVDNKIDVSVLQYLTDQDLKEIGIPLGHRRKMLAAIDKLSGQPAGAVKEGTRASTVMQGDSSMIRSDTAHIVYFMAGTIPVHARDSWVLWFIGYLAIPKGSEFSARSLGLAEHLAFPLNSELALLFNATLHLERGEPELALRRLGTAEALAMDQRLAFIVEPQFFRGAALMEQGAYADAVACLRAGLAGRLGTMRHRPYGLARLAEALALLGDNVAALATAADGLETTERMANRQWEPELQRLAGVALWGPIGSKKLKWASKRRCVSLKTNARSPMNCALQRTSLVCRGSGADVPKPLSCSHQFAAGSRGIRHR
jgi:hypothetical protein